MRRSLVAASLLAALALAGCGGGDQEASDTSESTRRSAGVAGAGSLVVVATDIAFPEKTYTAPAGDVAIEYRNEGSIAHTLLIDKVRAFKLEVAAKGDDDTDTVALEPGTYTIYCDVPGHRAAGMEATLQVG